MSTSASGAKKLKINDRVKRSVASGCIGTIKEVKSEVTAVTAEAREKGTMVGVLWDNGTTSFLGPNALEVVKSS